MPVFTEFSTSSRDLRVLPSFAPPLPRFTPAFSPKGDDEKYEVVVSGAGPAGLFLTLLLARYGLSDASLLCIDSKPTALKSGQADGLQPRTLEVLKSLGLVGEFLTEGCQMWEIAFWNPDSKGEGIERTSIVPDVALSARFPHEVTIHQGRIERVFEDDLQRYSKRGVERSTTLTKVVLDEAGDPEFPVLLEIEGPSGKRTVRTKHLVGADGAHSVVRRSMGLKLVGETSDFIWGVTDFVADTDFPDIRRRCAIHSDNGSVMVIPRERIATGEYLTRLYVHVQDHVKAENDLVGCSTGQSKDEAKARREKITFESILAQGQEVLKPYYIKPKRDDAIDWWAAYQIGQRMTERFVTQDSKGVNRVFIVGDACHTHSPKAGQGMNVSMMDSYNLAWKLIHHLNGLTPHAASGAAPDTILDTFETERRTIAEQLIKFDKDFSSMFSGKIGAAEDGAKGLTHEEFLDVFSTGNGFTSGCGIEYPENALVEKSTEDGPVKGTDFLNGVLRPGRRLLNVKVKRHADGNPRDLQDDFPSVGRYAVLVFTSHDLLCTTGQSATALTSIGDILYRFPPGLIELTALYTLPCHTFDWKDVPSVLKQRAEMRFHNASELEDAYKAYGVDQTKGAIAVLRPDGYIGTVASLSDVGRVEKYFRGCLKTL
ncbi:FAD binding domain-containing protein [Xylogone sp. PMI_703]|nr:FAD binding domain-containing protein [Xylogone sp. PMI_703]